MTGISDELFSVFQAEEHFFAFQQSPGNRENIFTVFGDLNVILNSEYSSLELKNLILLELWIQEHPVLKKIYI